MLFLHILRTLIFPCTFDMIALVLDTLIFPVSSQLMMYVQKLITNRKVQEQQQQLVMQNQANYLQQLAMQNGMMGGAGLSQMDLVGLYQQLHGLGGMGKNPGPSKGL